jgi:DNA-binding CsgD family transcriptional regulator
VPTEGAEAILDRDLRLVHAEGAAGTRDAQIRLLESARARARAIDGSPGASESLRGWRPLTNARWTLVDSFERDGTRYIVARENQCSVAGLADLSPRERQVLTYVGLGQSTKETAYALGISDSTTRVFLRRGLRKLGMTSRTELLRHPQVRRLRGE